jgi:hypothetical protein
MSHAMSTVHACVCASVLNRSKEVGALKQRWTRQLEGRTVLLGVDGLDATKVTSPNLNTLSAIAFNYWPANVYNVCVRSMM